MTSLASTNGPSITLSLLSDIFTCAPVAAGIRPPSSIMRPALISRSRILLIASIRPGFGIIWPLGEVTMYMKRMVRGLLLRREVAILAAKTVSLIRDDEWAAAGSTAGGKKFRGVKPPVPPGAAVPAAESYGHSS